LTGRYRWIRDGEPAVQPDGQILEMQAVLVGEITARPLPDDPAGRLYIPIRSGPATLYLEGRSVEGRWDVLTGSGVTFYTSDGTRVDLSNLRTWTILTPNYASRFEL
ncbi:MAG TPA: DUF3048 C-terminal domain-containing protein, partial [Trueperaceae bacterium]|nr:DUF3048 C-terminal domain-containing protein [Trueperaceae bacterium]